jgi:hypothetical protein
MLQSAVRFICGSTIRYRLLVLPIFLVGIGLNASAQGQLVPAFNFGGAPGVYLDTDGKVQCRVQDSTRELAAMRARARAARLAEKDPKLAYVSLPRLFSQLQSLRSAKKEIPDELKYLGGLTQIHYVFVFPDERDLVIAGPAEPWHIVRGDGDTTQYVVGTRTGHPILQLDDLIVAMRTAEEGRGQLFGCGIYPSPNSLKIADDTEQRMALKPRAERMQAMVDELGPQEVRIFGTRNDTRLAFICVAADYEMKRYAMGLDRSPISGVGNGVDHSRTAANKYWFEASYEPLRVSKDGNAYEIRGQRLLIKAGGFDFDPRGATEKAMTFASQFTKNMPALATAVPLYAELQNVTDESLLANLIRRDRLAEKVGWDQRWLLDDSACPVEKVPVPRTAQTLVGFTSGSIVAGGVMLTLEPWVANKSREYDESNLLGVEKSSMSKIQKASSADAAVFHRP